jgi:hypothetical protein
MAHAEILVGWLEGSVPTDDVSTDGFERMWERDVSAIAYRDEWKRPDTNLLKEVDGVYMGTSRYMAITCEAREVRHQQKTYEFQVQSNAETWGLKNGITTLICVTMYNEDEDELHATLNSIARNIYFCSKMEMDNPHRRDWREVAVVIVSDGREKAALSTKNYAARHGGLLYCYPRSATKTYPHVHTHICADMYAHMHR